MPTLKQALNEYNDLRYNYMLIDPIYHDIKLLENKDLRHNEPSNITQLPFHQDIEFKNVSFMYEGAASLAIEDINLRIPKRASVAFVGSTGAGKTTLVDLLLGLLHPLSGTIKVDGASIHSNLPGWLLNVGYIPQEIYLIDDTIANNVAFGLNEHQIDQEKLMAAIRSACLEQWIEELPNGLQTKVGNNGVRLSGGQKQRIGIARALYHKPQILIMDEATSALDNTTEKNIMQAIEHLRNDYTILMIAHRLSTIKDCDQIYFMSNGQIISSGSYEELLSSEKDFKNMAL
jgi:ATP-binding cassette subfamily C protein